MSKSKGRMNESGLSGSEIESSIVSQEGV